MKKIARMERKAELKRVKGISRFIEQDPNNDFYNGLLELQKEFIGDVLINVKMEKDGKAGTVKVITKTKEAQRRHEELLEKYNMVFDGEDISHEDYELLEKDFITKLKRVIKK